MKISSANNLPEELSGSSQGSFIDTNSISGDSDIDAASAAGDQNQVIGELKKTIKENQRQISELEGRLNVTEIQLECQKDKVKDKDEVIRVLQNSIELITKTSELAIKELQKSEAVACNNGSHLQKENDLLESIDEIKSKVKDNNVDNFGAQLQEFECQAKQDSADSHEVDDNLEKFQEQLDKCKKQNELLELKNSQLKVELDELKSKMIESQKIEEGLRKQVSELDNNFLSVSAKLKESSEKLAEFKLFSDSFPDKQETVVLNNTKNPKLKVIERDGLEPFISVIEAIPSAWSSGWIVIQRRINGNSSLSASRTDFENGFGDITASFWLGLNLIHELTTSQRHELYIKVVDCDGVTAYARYDHFEIGNKEENYKIKSLGSYSGNAGDVFRSHESASIKSYNNGQYWHSWWEASPTNCNLNGMYNTSDQYGFFWGRLSLGSKNCHLKSCQMWIRPKIK
ncbi:angiopoietin-2 [Drosophila kikkawai]|uniref:Angiopoietin-2 n=1 Tax=Drosophila kikkawai TaxID=30033 RepID=A0A6P4JH86_DROKI|nr:angiopoietin-2 [Drosophila kikkawai]